MPAGLFRIGGEDRFVAVSFGYIHDFYHVFDGDGFLCFDIDTGIVCIFQDFDDFTFEQGNEVKEVIRRWNL